MRRRPAARAAILLALIVLVLWGFRHAGRALVVSKDVGPPDAVVVLASHEWERLPAAADLARRYPSSVVLLTVPRVVTKFNCHDCAGRPAWLTSLGVAGARIVELPDRTSNTYDEAVAARTYAGVRGFRKVMVVTSPYHSRRALRVFEHVMMGTGVEVGVRPSSTSSEADPAQWWWHSYDRWYVPYEWAALVKYRWKYGVPLK